MKTDLKTQNCSNDFRGLGVGQLCLVPGASTGHGGLSLTAAAPAWAQPCSLCSSVPSHLPRPLFGTKELWGGGQQ